MTTITIDRELLEQALAALETMTDEYDDSAVGLEIEAIHALRAALEAPATAPEKTVKEIMEFARHYAADTFSSATLEDKIRRSLAAPATAPAQPAWHDAPTVPGVWICDEGDICYTWTAHNIEILDQFDPGDGLRWYGPIPEDRQ